jgi:hypothetical protein
MFNGKINYKWPCSIAMLNYHRVSNQPMIFDFDFIQKKQHVFIIVLCVFVPVWLRILVISRKRQNRGTGTKPADLDFEAPDMCGSNWQIFRPFRRSASNQSKTKAIFQQDL